MRIHNGGPITGGEQPSTSGRTWSASHRSHRTNRVSLRAPQLRLLQSSAGLEAPKSRSLVALPAVQDETAAADGDWAVRLLQATSKKRNKKSKAADASGMGFAEDYDDRDNAGGSMVEESEDKPAKRLPPEMRFFDTVSGDHGTLQKSHAVAVMLLKSCPNLSASRDQCS